MPRALGTYLFILFLLILTGLTGYNYFFQPFNKQTAVLPSPPVITPTPSVSLPTTRQLALKKQGLLSVTQKVGALLAMPISLSSSQSAALASSLLEPEEVAFLEQFQPRVLTVYGNEVGKADLQQLRTELTTHTASHTALLAVDYEGGRVARLTGQGFIRAPSWSVVCGMDLQSRRELFKQVAAELRQAGIALIFGPVVDVGDAAHSALGDRLCSDDPARVAAVGSEFIEALRQENIIPTLKHFPGIGSLAIDLHTRFAVEETNPAEVAVFKNILEKNPQIGVMTSHAGIDNQFRTIPCSLSKSCVHELQNVFPNVLTVTDALEMNAARYSSQSARLRSLSQVAKDAIYAGNHLLVFGDGVTVTQLREVALSIIDEYERSATFSAAVDAGVVAVLERSLTHEP